MFSCASIRARRFHLLGRVNATLHVVERGAIPFGALAGGVLGDAIGLRPTLAGGRCRNRARRGVGGAARILTTALIYLPVVLDCIPLLEGHSDDRRQQALPHLTASFAPQRSP